MNLSKNTQTRFDEISQYVKDLEKITKLRDHAMQHGIETELANYQNTLDCMQLVLVHLNERLTPKRKK